MKPSLLILVLAVIAVAAGSLLLLLPDEPLIDGGEGPGDEAARERLPYDPWRVDDPVADREKNRKALPDDARAAIEARIQRGRDAARQMLAEARHYDLDEVDRLLALVVDPDSSILVREFALELVGHNLSDEAGDRLHDFLRDQPGMDPRSLWRTLEMLSDRSAHGRHPPAEDVEKTLRVVMLDERMPPDNWPQVADGFVRLGFEAPTAEFERVFATSDDPERRRAAGEALLHATRDRIAVDAFREAIRSDPTGLLGDQLVLHAVEMHHDRAGDLLMAIALDDEAPPLARATAARHAGTFEWVQSTAPLIEILERGSAPDEVQAAIGEALAASKPEGLARRLEPLLRSASSPATRKAVAAALGGTGDPSAGNALRDVLRGRVEGDASVRAAYVGAMAELAGSADRRLFEELAESDPSGEVRAAAARALTRLEEILLSNPDR